MSPEFSDQPRICLVSLRGANKHAAWCSNYEFEDVICTLHAMRFGNWARGSVPEGLAKIARRFNAGNGPENETSPEGTAEGKAVVSTVPSGLIVEGDFFPALKRWAIVLRPSGTTFRLNSRKAFTTGDIDLFIPNPASLAKHGNSSCASEARRSQSRWDSPT